MANWSAMSRCATWLTARARAKSATKHRAVVAHAVLLTTHVLAVVRRKWEGQSFSINEHDVDLARAMDAQSQCLLDVASATGAGNQREVAAIGKDIGVMLCL